MDADGREARPPWRDPGERLLLLGRVGGVPVLLSPTWFIIAALLTVTFAPVVVDRVPGIGWAAYPVAFVFAVLLYASVFVHELGHVLMARAFGLPVRRITLNLLGGLSEITREPPTPAKEFAVSAIGPAVSLGLGGLGVLALRLGDPSGIPGVLLLQLTVANLFVGVFNLLPGLPLDGGRVVRAAVWGITGRSSTGTRAAGWAGRVVSVVIVALPFGLAAAAGSEPSLISVAWASLIAVFVWIGSSQALRTADLDAVLPMLTARTLARRAVPTAGDTPLALALQRMTQDGGRALVVVDPAGAPVAIVHEASVAAVPLERRPWIAVSTVSRRLQEGSVLPVGIGGRDLLDAMAAAPLPEYLVLDDERRVFGVLSAADVEAALGQRR